MKADKGQAALEFGLLAPFLIALILAILDAALLTFSYISVTNAVREGARCGAVGGTNGAVEQRVVDTSSGFAEFVNITERGDIGENITVEVEYTYDFILPVGLIPGVPDTATITKDATMRMEQSPPYDKGCETGA